MNRADTLELPLFTPDPPPPVAARRPLAADLAAFCEFGQPTRELVTHATTVAGQPLAVPTFVNETLVPLMTPPKP